MLRALWNFLKVSGKCSEELKSFLFVCLSISPKKLIWYWESSIFVFAVAGQSFAATKSFQYKNDPAITTKKQPRHDLIYSLVHAITPLEENKSFLEKVQSAGKLCGVEELWNRQKRSPSPASASLTSEVNREDCEETDSDSDDLLSSLQTSSHIKWSEKSKAKHQQPKSRLMPSFTKKSLEFHNCPEAFPKQRPKGMWPMHFSWGRHKGQKRK